MQDVYGMVVARRGRVRLQGGVRAERAGARFDLRIRDQRYDNPYNSVFPSGLVSFALSDADQLKLSYSTRIRRPDDPDLLDPTPTDSYGSDVTLALGSGGRVSGFIGGSAYHQRNNASNLDPSLSASTFGWSVRTNTAFRVSRRIDAQALVAYAGRTTVDQGWNAARTRISVGIRDKLLADRMSLTLRVTDPFSTARERSATLDPAFMQINDRTRAIRGLQLNVTWMLGRPSKKNDQIELNTG